MLLSAKILSSRASFLAPVRIIPTTYRHTNTLVVQNNHNRSYHATSSALGLFDGGKGDREQGNFLTKALNKVKNFVTPKSEEEKKAEIAKAEVKSGIQSLLKDAPLPIRMMGRLVAPLISNLAQEMGAQAKQVEDLLEDARGLLIRDYNVIDALGEPIRVGAPFQQSSSSMSINGKSETNVSAAFEVQGSRGTGIATMVASSSGGIPSIKRLALNVGGRNIDVDTSGKSSRSVSPSMMKNDDGIIDAEFIDKTYNR